jgi:NO-binding membrane sensor protein with MHYT domain
VQTAKAFSTGVIGIFGMHLIGMVAISLKDNDNHRYHVEFYVAMTIVCTIVVFLATLLGMYIASKDSLYALSKSEIMEILVANLSGDELKRYRNLSQLEFFFRSCFYSPWRFILGGIIVATGVLIMHYVNLASNSYDGAPIFIEWNIGVIVADCLIALVAGTAALWVLFRFLSVYPGSELLRNLCAIVFTIAKCAVHYTGATAATYRYDTTHTRMKYSGVTMNNQQTVLGCLIASFFCSWIIVMLIFSDLRTSNILLNTQIRVAEQVIMKVKADTRLVGATASIVKKYKFAKPNKSMFLASKAAARSQELAAKNQMQLTSLMVGQPV